MDNTTFHKRQDILPYKTRDISLYLPAYSPDFNPIEHKLVRL
ncbi:MAG: transposase [Nitrosomonas sp.]|nr:transposase [Nitrosomonas sp.]MCW5607206.1 transposase [Nitrosomonas sp.]